MDKALAAWAEKLEKRELPAFRHNVEELARLVQDDDVGINRIADVIERDLALTVRLLCQINKLRHRHLNTEITTVKHALMMLGTTHIQQLPKNVPLVEEQHKGVAQQIRKLYSRFYHAACQARDWARYHKEFEPDENFMVTFLHGIAEVLLWVTAPKKMVELLELEKSEDRDRDDEEYVVFGFSLDMLTRKLAVDWGLPSLVADCLNPENAHQKRVQGILYANRLARSVEKSWYRYETTQIIKDVAKFLPKSFGGTAAQLHDTAAYAAREYHHFGPQLAAANLLLPSTEEADPEWEPDDSEAAGDFCLCPQQNVFNGAMGRLQSHMDNTLTLSDALDLATTGMHSGLGLSRVVFALLNPEKTELRARAIVGAESDPRFERFHIYRDDSPLFNKLLEKPQALWVDASNKEKFLPMIHQRFLESIGTSHFFVMSVFVKGQAVGLFYADRHKDYCHLDSRAYHRFKQLCGQTAKTMEHLAKK